MHGGRGRRRKSRSNQRIEKPQEPTENPRPTAPPGRTVTRAVGRDGRISLACFAYPVGRWLAGETVDVVLRDDGLLEVFHRGILIKAHAQRHEEKSKSQIPVRSQSRQKPLRPSSDRAVVRMVDPTGCISFAGTSYRVGKALRGSQVEVETTAETVRIFLDGECVRTHKATHDPAKLHGAFATPGGRPRKAKAG